MSESVKATIDSDSTGNVPGAPATRVIKRHTLATRLWHWTNLVCLIVLLMSGLRIFNAHPALYWGEQSDFANPFIAIHARTAEDGERMGVVRIAGQAFDTTGVLGLSDDNGQLRERAFPRWATLPGDKWLTMGRNWHFLAAWIFVPLVVAYLLYILLGLTMAPSVNAAWPWLTELFGGRQSARTFHFLCATALIGFFVVHIALVLVSGVFNNLRSMVSGRYRIQVEAHDGSEPRHD